MDTNDDFLPVHDVDVDAERFVDPTDDELDLPDALDPGMEGSVADVIDQHLSVPIDDDAE
jgi:hypothetical protein